MNLTFTASAPIQTDPEEIHVSFTYEGKELKGILSYAIGAGSLTYFLHIDNYYFGQLVKGQNGWQFSTQKGYFPELAKYFGELVKRH